VGASESTRESEGAAPLRGSDAPTAHRALHDRAPSFFCYKMSIKDSLVKQLKVRAPLSARRAPGAPPRVAGVGLASARRLYAAPAYEKRIADIKVKLESM